MTGAVINAAGKLTALGGSAQSPAVSGALKRAAGEHVDLAMLREEVSGRIAELCGSERACVTSGAAAGIAIAIAACITGENLDLIAELPQTGHPAPVLLQAGHNVNFGAPVEQMIRLGGGSPSFVGHVNHVTVRQLEDALANRAAVAMLYVQSHHTVQTNQVGLSDCIAACGKVGVPVIVDAAAEEDLKRYIQAGADLVIYSGGKAFGGPTSGFIVGREALVRACEMQSVGIARPMKIGKEAIAGLATALEEYVSVPESVRLEACAARNRQLMEAISDDSALRLSLKPDEAGRPFDRVAVSLQDGLDIRSLVAFLSSGEPSIRTRNHHLDSGYLLIDPRELRDEHVRIIAERLRAFGT